MMIKIICEDEDDFKLNERVLRHLTEQFPELEIDMEEKLEDPKITLFNNWGVKRNERL